MRMEILPVVSLLLGRRTGAPPGHEVASSRPADGGTTFTTAQGQPVTFARGPVWVVLAYRPQSRAGVPAIKWLSERPLAPRLVS